MGWRLLSGILNMVLLAEAAFAFSPSNPEVKTKAQPAAHVDSLRRVLGISSHTKLEWQTSTNGIDTLELVDDFNRSAIGLDWDYDTRYWEIKNGELVLNANATSEWRYLATFKPIGNNGERRIFSVSYRWGKQADSVGIGEGAHALMLDQPTKNASGYWLWRRTNQERVFFYAIKNGNWEYWPDSTKAYEIKQSHRPLPKAGDVIEAVIRNEPAAVFFDYYINGRWDATLQDTSKEFAKNVEWYNGVFIHGQNLNNQVDDFTVRWLEEDAIPPANVTNLRAVDSTRSSVKLEWTMTGDNQFDGQADHLEIRYSTSPLNSFNFSSAKLAANIPGPASPGTKQQFFVTGLQLNTTYYFALRVYDEVGNVSGLSNVVKGNTKAASVAQLLRLVEGCGQSAIVGQALASPIVAEVLDQYGLGFKGKYVKFTITAGGGKIQNQDTAGVTTDINGRASVSWSVGPVPGMNQMTIRSAGLSGTPLQCQATATTGVPANISLETGSGDLHPVNTAVDLPGLKVMDVLGNAVPGVAVQYRLAAGGGSFVNGQPPDQKTFVGQTDAFGIARARFNTSASYGDTSKIMMALPANGALQTSLRLVTAPPETLLAVSGDQQAALIGNTLAEPLKIKILDAAGSPAKQYPVTFTVLAGGTLGNGTAKLETKTNDEGFAQTTLKLGPDAGANRVQALAKFKSANLRNSPFVFTATATATRPSPVFSSLSVSPASGVPADSVSAVLVTISVRDEFDNALPGKTVRIKVSGKKNYIKQPAAPTDQNGEATAEIRSTFAELKTIKALIMPENLTLNDSLKIRFHTIAAARMRKESGDRQTAKVRERLPENIIVKLLDKFGNPPQPTSVVFNVTSGGGKIIGPFVVSSDNQGLARVVWQLGDTAGVNKLEARVQGLQGSPLLFTATAESTSGVNEGDHGIFPRAFALLQNSPNPFNPETNIHFELAEAAEVILELFDLNGRSVGKILQTSLPPGKHAVKWSGKGEFGRQLDSGVYLYRLHARYGRTQKEFTATRKLTLLK